MNIICIRGSGSKRTIPINFDSATANILSPFTGKVFFLTEAPPAPLSPRSSVTVGAMANAVCISACNTDFACVESCATAAVNPVASAGITVFDVVGTIFLLMASAMFSGLTLGVMGLDVGQLELKITAGTPEEKMQAEKILPIRRRGNLLLCTLLLGNTCVNAGIAIMSASMVSGVVGSLVGPAFILIFGEIIPQSVCSRYGLAAGAKMADITRMCILIFFPFAFPLSKALDYLLGDEIGTVYTRQQLKELGMDLDVAEALAPRPSPSAVDDPVVAKQLVVLLVLIWSLMYYVLNFFFSVES